VAAEEPPSEQASREPARRLFFALWPDEPMRQAMAQAIRKGVRASGGRPVPPANLHVTLAFLGATPEQRLPELAGVARVTALEHAGEPLELAFDHLEYWQAAHLLCASPAGASEPAAVLAGRLQARLAASGFAPDLKSSWSVELNTIRPFRPHVTLARKVYRSPRSIEMQPVTWSFTDFVLVDSKTLPQGAAYTVLEKFPLDQ
jgi:RNA 2',3'-cyclic 3'-phosphodiesterase